MKHANHSEQLCIRSSVERVGRRSVAACLDAGTEGGPHGLAVGHRVACRPESVEERDQQ